MRLLCKNGVLAVLFVLSGSASPAVAAAHRVPRTILALYDSTYDKEIADTPIHQIVEMPLNHLGLIVKYHDINAGLPRVEDMQDLRGVIAWFQSDTMPAPLAYLAWAEALMDAGKKFVVVGELSASRDPQNHITPISTINRFWSRLGLRSEDQWTKITYDIHVSNRVPAMVEFERSLQGVLPSFLQMKRINRNATSYLTVRRGSDPATDCDLVVTNENGGYIAGDYTHFHSGDLTQRQWYINPFEYFRIAFNTDELPKPDTTTLMGRRIFYSQVDGDGWRNVTELPAYRKRRALSAEVVLNEVIRAFPELPVTVAPIAADLDQAWHGTPESLEIGRQILALPNVEAGTHTYSHPLDWQALANASGTAETARRSILSMGISELPEGLLKLISSLWDPAGKIIGDSGGSSTNSRYEKPRTYDLQPFSLDREIRGSIEFISKLLPVNKRVEVVQWSGNTRPFEAAVAASRAAGVRNINGGETRFDEERQSYGWVSPIGRQVGQTWQVYASNSNENNYTELWTDRFFGFRYLTKTINNTESPLRIKPINIYYHMYSGEKLSSLQSLVENLRYASSLDICPISAGQYAGIADGFYSASIEALDDHTWKISNRGDLGTIRFDNASQYSVDFSKSTGVIGQKIHQGKLYVALDDADALPILALRHVDASARNKSDSPQAYLIESRWRVSNYRQGSTGFSFAAHGFGAGAMQWKLPKPGRALVRARDRSGHQWQKEIDSASTGLLEFAIPLDAHESAFVTVDFGTGSR